MNPLTFLILMALLMSPAFARKWRSADGKQSFEATYVSHDGKSVTLRKATRILTFSVEKLHEDDQIWLNTNHPVQSAKSSNGPPLQAKPAPKGAAFDTLEFGDTRKEVLEKLNASPLVDGTAAEVLLARVGLNGIYRTKQTIGGLHCHLYFDWTSNNLLKEVTLRTKGQSISAYGSTLYNNWSQLIDLLTVLHGEPINRAEYPNSQDLQDGLILNSHLWRTEEGHSVLLGTGQEGTQYSVSVRITSERINPVPTQE